jgi:hypothetical protein
MANKMPKTKGSKEVKLGRSSDKSQETHEACTAGIRNDARNKILDCFCDLSRQAKKAGFYNLHELIKLSDIFLESDAQDRYDRTGSF